MHAHMHACTHTYNTRTHARKRPPTFLYVVPVYRHIIVSIGALVFVMKPKRMQELMHDRAVTETAIR